MRNGKGRSSVSRVTVSLPTALLEAADEKLAQHDESRSALIRRLVENALREIKEREDVERYVRGYQEQPQTEDEVGWFQIASLQHLEELPWEPRK